MSKKPIRIGATDSGRQLDAGRDRTLVSWDERLSLSVWLSNEPEQVPSRCVQITAARLPARSNQSWRGSLARRSPYKTSVTRPEIGDCESIESPITYPTAAVRAQANARLPLGECPRALRAAEPDHDDPNVANAIARSCRGDASKRSRGAGGSHDRCRATTAAAPLRLADRRSERGPLIHLQVPCIEASELIRHSARPTAVLRQANGPVGPPSADDLGRVSWPVSVSQPAANSALELGRGRCSDGVRYLRRRFRTPSPWA